jgi:hypothetical protein
MFCWRLPDDDCLTAHGGLADGGLMGRFVLVPAGTASGVVALPLPQDWFCRRFSKLDGEGTALRAEM